MSTPCSMRSYPSWPETRIYAHILRGGGNATPIHPDGLEVTFWVNLPTRHAIRCQSPTRATCIPTRPPHETSPRAVADLSCTSPPDLPALFGGVRTGSATHALRPCAPASHSLFRASQNTKKRIMIISGGGRWIGRDYLLQLEPFPHQ